MLDLIHKWISLGGICQMVRSRQPTGLTQEGPVDYGVND
jgi:hypothetical protein